MSGRSCNPPGEGPFRAVSSWRATSCTAPALSLRGSAHALPSRQGCAGLRRDWRRLRPRPSERIQGAIRSTRRVRRAGSCPRVGSSPFPLSLTMPRYRQGAALRSGRRSPSHQASAPDGQRVGRQRAAPPAPPMARGAKTAPLPSLAAIRAAVTAASIRSPCCPRPARLQT